jgi:hypothetical protein
MIHFRYRDNVVGKATCYGLEVSGFKLRSEHNSFFFSTPVLEEAGAHQPPARWVPALSSGDKAALKTDPPSGVTVNE